MDGPASQASASSDGRAGIPCRAARQSRPRSARRRLPGAGSLICAVAVVSAAAAPYVAIPAGEPTWKVPSLPQSSHCASLGEADPVRASRITRVLGTIVAGQALLAAAQRPLRVCFRAGGESAVTSDATLVLDSRRGDRDNAARLGHLLLHVEQGAPELDEAPDAAPCDGFVSRTLRAEAAAHAKELELRQALGVDSRARPFPFEEQFWRTPAAERIELVHRYFADNPDGAPGLPGFAGAARRRCESLRGR